jgi:subtilisin family serine protease
MAATSTAGAKAPGTAKSHPAPGVKVPAHSLKGKAASQTVLPRGMKAKPGATEPGSTAPAGVPTKGKYAFLVQLSTSSTLSAYNGARASGKTAMKSAAKTQFSQVKAAQAGVESALPAGSKVLYRMHSALAGIAVTTDVRNYAALQRISGVKAVYPIAPKSSANSYAVPLVKAPQAWTAHGDLGANSTIAVIDTGVDYTHANFGGPGTVPAYNTALAADAAPADPALFPNDKVIDGFDFAGDTYDADPNSATYNPIPAPDPNPLDCGGHGSHVAGTAAGLGENSDGSTYTGAYNTSTPFSTMRIGPGMAPEAKILAYKVFGCEGSTDVVGQAIDAASDPNGDGDPSDHASVINMSLGSDFGSPQDGDSVASNAASALGISVVVASGNGGDYYDIGGSPGDATRTIAVANSIDASNQIDTLHVSAPASVAGTYGAERSVAYDWANDPDLSGVVAPKLSAGNEDGCDPLSVTDATKVAGKIAFLEWTDDDTVRRCGSVARSGNVAAAGAIGFIFADDAETFAAGITGSAVIPGVLIVKSAGDALRAELANGVTVSGTSAADFTQIVPGDDDKVNASSSRGVRGAGNVKPDVTAVGTSVFSTAVGSGNEGVAFTGTSMATPMVAGLSALVTSLHPDWTAEEVKADIMNTAGQDLFTGDSHSGDIYAPNRVGAGRIQADQALDNTALAMVQDDPGAVSVSFGPVAVTAPMSLTKTIKVVNKGLSSITYDIAYDAITEVPGVDYTVSAPTITVPRQSTRTFTVSFVVTDPTLLTKTIDSTVDRNQADFPREYVADASGRLLLSSVGRPTLRVPVYSAPRPASVMTQPASLTMPTGSVQHAVLPLSGHSVDQGSGAEAVQSTVSGFELQAVSGLAPSCAAPGDSGCVHFADERSADLKYVGTTSNAPQLNSIGGDVSQDGLLYFSITTQGAWRTAASTQEFDVYLDTNGDNQPDAVMFNTRLGDQDIMVSETLDLTTGDVLDIEGINDRLGDTDTALFDSDTMVLPVLIGALPGVTSSTRVRYGVASFSNAAAPPVDVLGFTDDGSALNGSLSTAPYRPGLAVYGSFDGSASPLLFQDAAGSVLNVRRDAVTYANDHGLGALIVHFHNKVGNKAQRMALASPSKSVAAVSLKVSATRVKAGTKINTLTVVKNTGVKPTGRVNIRHVDGGHGIYGTGTLTNGFLSLSFTPPRGTIRIRAEYLGDAHYLAGNSAVITLTVS